MINDNLTNLFDITRKKNAELILKSPDKIELKYLLIDFTNDKISLLEKKRKNNENLNTILSEILSSSLLIGFLLDGKSINSKIDEFICAINLKKQIKYTQQKLFSFADWSSIANYILFIEAILGLLYMLDYDFLNIEETIRKL